MSKVYRTTDQKIRDLYVKLAGEKKDKVDESTQMLIDQGKSIYRAMADALEKHKCLKNSKAEELQ